jgi:hydrogenase expression/formation protein HypC
MCLAIPVKVIKIIDKEHAIVDCSGIMRQISISLLDNVVIDDYVILHVGFAIEKLNEAQAKKTLSLLNQILEV